MNWIYSVVSHKPRKILGISINEFVVLDAIYKTQTSPIYSQNGMTSLGCHEIGEALDLSSGTVKGIFDRMINAGYLERVGAKHKYVTEAFYTIAYLNEEEVQKLNVQKLNAKGLETERKKVQKLNKNRSETERYKGKKEKIKETKEFIPPTLEEVEQLVLNSLRIHLENQDDAELLYKAVAKDYFVRNEIGGWVNNKGEKISSLAGSINTAVSNSKKWGELGRMLVNVRREQKNGQHQEAGSVRYDRVFTKRTEKGLNDLFTPELDQL